MKLSAKFSENQASNWVKLSRAKAKLPQRRIKPVFAALITAIIVTLLCAGMPPTVSQAQNETKQVLYINSYHVGYKFSDDITRALAETFGDESNVELRVEYLDSKRIDDSGYVQLLYLLFQHKYKNTDLDLIISSDDFALNFLLSYADGVFEDVPIVFVGANYFDESRLDGYDNFTGISEEADIPGTLATALDIHPEVNQIVVVNDTSVTGQKVRQAFDEVTPQYPGITFEFLEDVTMAEVQNRVAALDENSLVLLTIFFKDREGTFFEYDQFSTLIAESSAVPVYATWDFSLGFGVVGGKLTSGYTVGQRGAALARRVLNGENPADIPVDYEKQSEYLFDYKALERFDIPLSALPQDSTVLDKPISFLETNRNVLIGSTISLIILIGIIVFLAINNNQRRQAQEELSASNQELLEIRGGLEREVANRTQALAISTEVSRRLSTILDQAVLVREVVEQLTSAFAYYHAHIYLFDENKQNLIMVGGTGDAGRAMLAQNHQIEAGRGLVGRAAASNAVVLIPDVSQAEGWLPNPLLPDTKAEAAVPIAVGEDVIGVLDVQQNTTNGLTEEDTDLIRSIANQVAIAIQNARAYTRSQRQAVREAQITAINQRIQSAATIDDILQIAVSELGQALDAESSNIELSMASKSNGDQSESK